MTVLDKIKSYKVASGKLVERTAEELARLEQRKAEQAEREAKSTVCVQGAANERALRDDNHIAGRKIDGARARLLAPVHDPAV